MTLDEAIEGRRDELIALTQDLVRMPTLNPPGRGYLEICEYLRDRLAPSGFAVEMVRAEGAPGDSDKYPRWNVVARREGVRPGECVHFNSHIDVVEVGQGWTVDPFGGEVRDGKLYGRGACDMKGGLAASIIAAEAFLEVHPDFAGAIEISGTADEESGGYGGVAYLAEKGFFDPARVQHVIIPEPLNKDRICLGHRGVWWAEVETKGRIAHGSMPFLGDCAVRHMGAVIAEMEESLFPALAEKRTEMPVVPEGARQSTLNINSIHGGEPEQEEDYTGLPAPCVPDRARMVIDRRFLIEEDLAAVKDEFRAVLERVAARRETFAYELRDLFEVLPTMTERDAPVVEAVAEAIRSTLGTEADYVVSPGTYDQKHIDRIGKLHNCIAYGPGILDLAHQPDEYVGIDDMVDSAKVMGRALERLLGVEAG
ncbi:acetylornithine deacetylase/succinyl-diaminopimelate desuccinylase family protein [Pontivivens ytuae]|uniref:Acetylornithine deacetylase/succinyl-diaminopimelate desuccinylase family protein n=1 Tax=Pontivivens ytuae TaxID=2789856 RepID=A0A7S9LNG7_9RHOB|nr:acetylornithine deacetylase/succinyl-diaminopimelate desuccinylase family protein [Pontivivens ytuae]QPH52257.1 acetylornithine deacetylase/succinyl-diaminopimelate desuccinylase family protein [Pontivivens ytuae]